RFLQWMRLDRLIDRIGLRRFLPGSVREGYDMTPRLKSHYGTLPEMLPAEGKRRARVALFVGCAADAYYPRTTLNTARVLQKNGCDVLIPKGQGCCGALHYHAAQEEPAKAFANVNCQSFPTDDIDAIIVNAAGCGAMLKDYGHLLSSPAAAKF